VKIDIPQKLMLELAMLPVEQQVEWINNCLPRDQLLIDAAFEAWHARGQMEPHEQQWRVWLMMAGRGFGKTRAGAEWVHQLASRGKVRIALVGASIDEGRDHGRGAKRPAERRQAAAPAPQVGAEPRPVDVAARRSRAAVFGRPCGRPQGAGTSFRVVRRAREMAPGRGSMG
jgi:hypothetical protein